uniref:Uncharacterized protein n=1 Tax=Knipowitschia caucasica TaxID=637954 RepID=A0AAV2MQD2_KNICA
MQAAEKSSWTFGEVYCTMLVACMSGTWIVLNRRWLKDVEKFLTFRTTSQLESFQNHILIFGLQSPQQPSGTCEQQRPSVPKETVQQKIETVSALYTERQVLAEFNQITSSKLGNDFVEALDCLTTQFIRLFKAKRGSAGAKLSKIVRHLDSCQRRWRKEKGTHQKRWWNCRKTLVTERSLKIIIL